MRRLIAKLMMIIRKHKYVMIKIDHTEIKGINPGYMQGGIIKAKVVDETNKSFEIRFTQHYLPLTFGVKVNTHIFTEWILKDDPRIVEILK